MKIKLKKGAVKPTRATEGAAGYDLYARENAFIGVSQVVKVTTGVCVEIPEGYAGFIYARSGLATKNGVRPANCVAVIDSDYRGELLVPLRVDGNDTYRVTAGERIAQLVIAPVFTPELEVVEELSETARGEGGFGSTGKNEIFSREEARRDILDALDLMPEGWLEEHGTTREAVCANADLLEEMCDEHYRSVVRYGCNREWSANDAVKEKMAEFVESSAKPDNRWFLEIEIENGKYFGFMRFKKGTHTFSRCENYKSLAARIKRETGITIPPRKSLKFQQKKGVKYAYVDATQRTASGSAVVTLAEVEAGHKPKFD